MDAPNKPPPPPLPPIPGDILARLNAIYTRLSDEIAATAVVCRSSGNCCNFDEFEHVLFASTMELTNLLAATPVAEVDFRSQLCPYWVDRKCTARDQRPLGCRVYFCDPAYQAAHSQRLYEKYHREIEELGIEWAQRTHAENLVETRSAAASYAYVPMVAALHHHVQTGQFFDPANPLALLSFNK